jgi:outer membrane protein assembly factor BamA
VRRRRILITGWILAAVGVLVLVAFVVAHVSAVQRSAWNRVTAAIEASTGYSISADRVSARLVSGRFEASGLRVSVDGRQLAVVERVVATWTWRGLAGTPRRLESLVIVSPAIALENLPAQDDDEEPIDAGELLGLAEVRTVEIRDGRLTGAAADIGWSMSQLRLTGGLENRRAWVDVTAGGGTLLREGRTFELGALHTAVEADARGFLMDHLRLDGAALQLDVGEAGGPWTGTAEMQVPLRAEAELVSILAWWDPSLLDQVELSGRLVLDGVAGRDAAGVPFAAIEHRGEPIMVSGVAIDRLMLSHADATTSLVLGGADWGRADVMVDEGSRVDVAVFLEDARVQQLAALSPQPLPFDVPAESRASGRLQASLTLPVQPETITGSADLVMTWPDGRLAVAAAGGYDAVTVKELTVTVPGGELEARGRIEPKGKLDVTLDLALADPARAIASVAAIWPGASAVDVGGGPLDVHAAVSGTAERPFIDAVLEWQGPVVAGESFIRLDARASGVAESVDWEAVAELVEGTTVLASGRTAMTGFETSAEWSVFSEDLEVLAARAPSGMPQPVCGRLAAAGHVTWNAGVWRAGGTARGAGVGTGDWLLDGVELAFVAEPERLEVTRLDALLSGARLSGWASVPLQALDSPLAAQFDLVDLDLATLALELPPESSGVVSGRIDVAGTAAEPTCELELEFNGRGANAAVQSATLLASLEEGVLRVTSANVESAGGSLAATAEVPLGDLPLPEWLWSRAPSGPILASAHGERLRAAPLLLSLGAADLEDADIVFDVDADVRWDLVDADQRTVEVVVGGAEIRSELEQLRAEGPIRLVLRDGRVVLDPVRLTGAKSRIELVGSFDPASDRLTTTVHATLDPAIGRLLPLPLSIRGPVELDAELDGPLTALGGTVRVNHRDGVMVMRDPAMEIRDLSLLIEIENGVPTIADGSAGLNRGTALIGGGWDVKGGQGIVIALEGVAFLLPYGILSRWNGTLNIDPAPDRLARMHGDLELEGGLWDRPFDYAGELFGTGDPGLAADDPLNDIVLDIEVRGRNGIEVDNNLGDFRVNWDLLHVGGTLATPLLEGQVKIAEGGLLTVAGTSIPVRRGVVEFTGQPGAEPRLEIVSSADIGVFDGSGQIDPTLIATRGLATGLGKALGFENETLQPAEIAIETGTDTTTRFAVGQRLSRNLFLIFSTDLTNAQDVQTLLQVDVPRVRGLALQAFQETATEEFGGAVIERLRWGGTAVEDGEAKIYRIRLEGEWPISKRRLTKAAGISKGQPYDDFLLFAAGIRMEQELAAHGYFDARVTAEAEGDEMLPKLVFTCEPGPLQEMAFTGHAPPKEIRRRVRALYQPPPQEDEALAAMRQVLTRHYAGEGFPDAAVAIARVDDRVMVEIDRGAKRKLSGPEIEGVPPRSAIWVRAALGSSAELAAALADPERANRIIRRALRDTGYRNVEEIRFSTEAVDDGEEVVKIEILPGRQDTIGNIELSGTDPLGLLDTGELGIKSGMALDRYAMDRAVNVLRREYQEAGYAEVEVKTRLEEIAPFEWMVWFEMQPGPKVTVDAITITGLRHLDEKVIRRGLSFAEGDLLRVSELDASATKIASFAPVQRVDVNPVPSGVGGSTVEVAVTEKPRWTVGGGAQFRSERGMQALVDLRDDNLFDRGFSLNLRGSWEASEQRALLVASLPPLPGGRTSISLTADYFVGDSKEDPNVLNEETTGGSIELSYLIGPASKVSAYTRASDTYLYEKVPDDFFPFEQTLRIASVGGYYTRDTFDDPFDPRSGSYLAADVEWSSSAFGSDLDSVRSLLTGSVVLEPRSGWTWAHRLRIGIAEALKGTNLDPTQRYFAGGQASMRGFVTNSVGPLVPSQDGGLVGAGGGALFILNEELRVPVWKKLRLAIFTDIGQVWEDWSSADSELSIGVGVGFRYSTPIGPLWGDIAWPVANQGISDGARYYFGVGRTF